MRSNGWFVVRAWILVVAFGLNVMPASAQPQQVSPGETYSTMMVAYVDPEIFPPTALEQLAKIVAADEKSLAKALGQESVQGAQLSLNAIPGSGSAVAIVARLHMGPTLKTASEKIQQACFESLKNRISERLRMFYLMRREQLQKQLEELVVRQKKGLSEIRDLRSQTSGPSPTALTEAFVSARAALEQAQTQKDVQEARRVTLMKSLAEIQAKKPGKDPVIEQLQLIVDLKRANFERAKLVSEKSKSIAPSELTQLQEEMAKAEAELRIRQAEQDKSGPSQILISELSRLNASQQENETLLRLLMTRLKVSQEQALQASRAQEVLSEAARMERSVQRLEEKIDALRIELDLMREPNVL